MPCSASSTRSVPNLRQDSRGRAICSMLGTAVQDCMRPKAPSAQEPQSLEGPRPAREIRPRAIVRIPILDYGPFMGAPTIGYRDFVARMRLPK
jgi:hypothetical protein